MKQMATSATTRFVTVSFLFVSLLVLSPALGMEPQGKNADPTMFPLTQSADTWFTQQSGEFRGIVVLKDQEAVTLLYHRGIKPIKAADHEHHVTVPRLKFYDSGNNSWDMETENMSEPVQIHTLSPDIEQWVTKKAGVFRAVVVLKLDGTADVYQPSAQKIKHTSSPMVLVNQANHSPVPVGNISYHLVTTPDMPDPRIWGCACAGGSWIYW